MPGTQELTRRIKSVKSTRKITRAMQMVSAAKMRKAQSATLASRTYSELAWDLVSKISNLPGSGQPVPVLLKQFTNAPKIAVVVISTNRGFVGSFTTNLLSKLRDVEKMHSSKQVELIVMGKKIADATTRQKKDILAEFPKVEKTIPVSGVYPIAATLVDMYESGKYSGIYLIYSHFVSTLTQKATAKQLLPFSAHMSEAPTPGPEYQFEPTPAAVIDHLLPRVLESQLYQAILESDASEHSARMVSMKSATDAAADLIDDLTLTFNQLRQNKITTELSEITAGKIALEKTN